MACVLDEGGDGVAEGRRGDAEDADDERVGSGLERLLRRWDARLWLQGKVSQLG